MTSTRVAREPLIHRSLRKAGRMLGPAGLFFKGFVKHPAMVGAIVPSSRRTIDRVLSRVDWENTRLFVEYGPGVGTFCRPVLNRLRRDGTLIVIDTNPDFIEYLSRSIGDSRFIAVHGSAAEVEDIIRAHGFEEADYILSGLPFTNLPPGVGPAIMAATHRVLRQGGAFLVYQYTARARALMGQYFHRIDKGFEPVNVPPCVISWGWKD